MTQALLELKNIFKAYPGARQQRRWGLDNICLSIYPGQTVGLLGPSGIGKSTLARIALGIERPDAGDVLLMGKSILKCRGKKRHAHFKTIQMVWQDPVGYLNPYQSVLVSVMEPLVALGTGTKARNRQKALALMAMLGLPESLGHRKPAQLSGGQCQRIAIARALAVSPKLLICDEALVSLDLAQQVEILKLLERLRKELNLAILFISHDRDTVRKLCQRVLIMAPTGLSEHLAADIQSPPIGQSPAIIMAGKL